VNLKFTSLCGKENFNVHRRQLLTAMVSTSLLSKIRLPASGLLDAALSPANVKADVVLGIAPVDFEIAPGKIIRTTSYNGSVPGPILRFREGRPVTIDVHNETDVLETVHWHGQRLAPAVDGSVEEGTPVVPAHGFRRFQFRVGPAGTRWFHTHSMAGADLTRAGFSGQYGFALIEPASHPGQYNQEIPIVFHHWEPKLVNMGPPNNGWEIDYDSPPSMARCWERVNRFVFTRGNAFCSVCSTRVRPMKCV
jgi:FtsP/CotA-like multicopper oxidase with cupredoxin domain